MSSEKAEGVVVTPETLPAVLWLGQKVITTELLAKVYGTADNNITKNFSNNKARFVEGKHYFRLTGQDLRAFKADRVTDVHPVTKSRAKELMLWTERGSARHAKMLETNEAWDVFETLEDCYFILKAQREAKADPELSTVSDRFPLYHFTIDHVLRHHLLFSRVYTFLNIFAGVRKFKGMTKTQAKETIEFADRFAAGRDTRADWQRIQANQAKLFGEPQQIDFVSMMLGGPPRLDEK